MNQQRKDRSANNNDVENAKSGKQHSDKAVHNSFHVTHRVVQHSVPRDINVCLPRREEARLAGKRMASIFGSKRNLLRRDHAKNVNVRCSSFGCKGRSCVLLSDSCTSQSRITLCKHTLPLIYDLI